MDHQSTEILVRVEAEDLGLTIEWAGLATAILRIVDLTIEALVPVVKKIRTVQGDRQYTHQSPTDAALSLQDSR